MSILADSARKLIEDPRLPRRETAVGNVVGLALAVSGAGMLVSAVVEKLGGGEDAVIFVASGLLVGIPGLALWSRTRAPVRIPAATVFAAVLFCWITFSLAATIPYLASGTITRFDLALFEAVAGFTTTAASILGPLSDVSHGLLFWRATTQWVGGIAAVVFAVSVLPFLGVGGMEMVGSAAAGPATERLGARVRSTARRLVPLYFGFTLLVAMGYVAFGMSLFDGFAYSFTTVSTGGFSTDHRITSFGPGVEWVAIAAMIIAGGSLALYWQAIRGKPLVIFRSAEFRAYILLVTGLAGVTVFANGMRFGFSYDVAHRSIFSMVSLSTTTGFDTTIYHDAWVPPLQLIALFAMAIGGMSGSTAGGFKTLRLMIVLGFSRRQVFQQLHPRAVSIVRLGTQVVSETVVTRVIGFFGLFMAVGALATVLVAMFGSDLRTAISAAVSALGNVGPALGRLGSTASYTTLHAGARAILMVVMLAGRLEIFPVLLGVVPLVRFVSDRLPRWGAQRFVRALRG